MRVSGPTPNPEFDPTRSSHKHTSFHTDSSSQVYPNMDYEMEGGYAKIFENVGKMLDDLRKNPSLADSYLFTNELKSAMWAYEGLLSNIESNHYISEEMKNKLLEAVAPYDKLIHQKNPPSGYSLADIGKDPNLAKELVTTASGTIEKLSEVCHHLGETLWKESISGVPPTDFGVDLAKQFADKAQKIVDIFKKIQAHPENAVSYAKELTAALRDFGQFEEKIRRDPSLPHDELCVIIGMCTSLNSVIYSFPFFAAGTEEQALARVTESLQSISHMSGADKLAFDKFYVEDLQGFIDEFRRYGK